jgi:cytochrome b subunit of formate dehydrogenase
MLEWFKSKRNIRKIGRWCGWAALLLLAFTLITGYGISQFRIVSSLTFGLLDKVSSHRWHHYTDIPLVIFTLAHVIIAVWFRLSAQKNTGKSARKRGNR